MRERERERLCECVGEREGEKCYLIIVKFQIWIQSVNQTQLKLHYVKVIKSVIIILS